MAKRKKRGGRGPLYQPGVQLGGRSLKRAARQLTRLEIAPQARQYDRLAQQLLRQNEGVSGGLGRLGERATGTVASSYRSLAQSAAENQARQQAIGSMLQQRAGQIGGQARQEMQGQQTGALGSYMQGLQMRGAPGGGAAQAALASQAQAEQGRQAQATQAAQNFAAAQAGAYSGYGAGIAQAAQTRGAASITDIQRQIANRIAQSALQTSLDVSEARGKAADVRALRGPTRVKNILALRESERNYGLSRQAVSMDRAQLAEQRRAAMAQEQLGQAELAQKERLARKQRRLDKWLAKQESQAAAGTGVLPPEAPETVSSAIAQTVERYGGNWPKKGNRKQIAKFRNGVMGAEGVKPEWKRYVMARINKALRKHGSL